ncbi:MAG: glycosyltransferase family 2 protein [Myxococcales bacterium]|nr:glycosyltransferase family 2 protein [Myxococcales bacterium]
MSSVEISVVIPAYNSASLLELTLAGFANGTADRDSYEIVVVNDGSSDRTDEVVASFADDLPLQYIRQYRNMGRAVARNLGIRRASGRVLMFCDADAIPHREFVRAHLEHQRRGEDIVVIGHKRDLLTHWTNTMPREWLIPLLRSGVPDVLRDKAERAVDGEELYFIEREDVAADWRYFDACTTKREPQPFGTVGENLADVPVAWSAFVTRNVSVPRSLLDRCGVFDETFEGWGYEDTDLGYRLAQAGAVFVYAPEAINHHQLHRNPMDWVDAYAQAAQNYRRFIRKHPSFETYLHWRYFVGLLDERSFHELVVTRRAAAAAGHEALVADYDRLSEYMAYAYCDSSDPSTWGLVRSQEMRLQHRADIVRPKP